MFDEGCGDEEAGVLEAGNSLESDSDDFVILDHGAAAVTGVDGGIGLGGEVGAVADVAVGLHFDARNDAAGVGDLFAAGGISICNDGGTDGWKVADFERLHSFEKAFVLWLDDRQVAIMSCVGNFGDV